MLLPSDRPNRVAGVGVLAVRRWIKRSPDLLERDLLDEPRSTLGDNKLDALRPVSLLRRWIVLSLGRMARDA